MAVNKVTYGGKTLVDLTSDTVTADKLASGVTAHDKSGNKITGTMSANCKIYEITLAKASGWVLLTTLDDDVMAHINDATLKVDFECLSPYVYTWYTGFRYHASNVPMGNYGGRTIYGMADRHQNETTTAPGLVYYPANHTVAEAHAGAFGQFRLNGNKYYIMPGDGFIGAGTYRLIFTW